MKRKWIHAGEFKLTKSNMEKVRGKSQTIENDSYTVRELLEKHTQGIHPAVSKKETTSEQNATFDDLDLEKVTDMDMVETEEISKEYLQKIEDLNQQKAEAETKKEKEEFDKLIEEKTNERLAKIEETREKIKAKQHPELE